MELSAKALRESLHTPRLKKQVQFLSIYTLKFVSCLNLMKICIYHLEHACVEHKKLCYVYSSLILFPKVNNSFSSMSYFLYVVKKKRRQKTAHFLIVFWSGKCVHRCHPQQMNVFDVKSHNWFKMWISLWVMAAEIVSCS